MNYTNEAIRIMREENLSSKIADGDLVFAVAEVFAKEIEKREKVEKELRETQRELAEQNQRIKFASECLEGKAYDVCYMEER